LQKWIFCPSIHSAKARLLVLRNYFSNLVCAFRKEPQRFTITLQNKLNGKFLTIAEVQIQSNLVDVERSRFAFNSDGATVLGLFHRATGLKSYANVSPSLKNRWRGLISGVRSTANLDRSVTIRLWAWRFFALLRQFEQVGRSSDSLVHRCRAWEYPGTRAESRAHQVHRRSDR